MENSSSQQVLDSPTDGAIMPGGSSAVADTTAATKRLARAWTAVRKAQQVWDFKGFQKAFEDYSSTLRESHLMWPSRSEALLSLVESARALTRTDQYLEQIESALRAAGLSPQRIAPGEFELPPFRLSLDQGEGQARLGLGRKAEKAPALAPKELAAWVRQRYERVARSRFDAERFKKDLLAAYQYANRAKYGGDVRWGLHIELTMIYELLTLRGAARADYPRQLFVFDLARLLQIPNLELAGRKFEFGSARGHDKIFIVVDAQGRESRLASLAVH